VVSCVPNETLGNIVPSANSRPNFGAKEAKPTTRKARSLQSHSLCALAISALSLTAYELLLGYILDPEYGDVTDAQEGTDITLTYTKPTKPGAYPQTSLKMRRNTSTLLEDAEAIPALLDGMPDFDSLFERLSPEQVDAILDEQLAGDGSAESRSRETTKYSTTDATDVDRAFNELVAG
jgi:hypothetical protein